jgi:hypothetical protein
MQGADRDERRRRKIEVERMGIGAKNVFVGRVDGAV